MKLKRLYEKMNRIDEALVRLTHRQNTHILYKYTKNRGKTEITNIRNERRNSITKITEIKRL